MKIICVGGGPAGLYAAMLLKKSEPDREVVLYERDAEDTVRGWGVTFWDDLLAEMRLADATSADAVAEAAARWTGLEVHVEHQQPVVDPNFWGHSIARSTLTRVLTDRARDLGVTLAYEHEVSVDEVAADADLVVCADGANSRFRQAHASELGTQIELGKNRFAWLATTKPFPAFRFAFATTPYGWLCTYAYAYADDASTFVVEMPPATFDGLGLADMSADETMTLLQEHFAWQLDGQPLLVQPNTDGTVPWRQFPTITNRAWHVDNVVLLGDVAHTTHYSIGFGTKLALEDAMALDAALTANGDLASALQQYGSGRRQAIRAGQRDATLSRRWFERLPTDLRYSSEDLASLLNRRRSRLVAWLPAGAILAARRLLKRRA